MILFVSILIIVCLFVYTFFSFFLFFLHSSNILFLLFITSLFYKLYYITSIKQIIQMKNVFIILCSLWLSFVAGALILPQDHEQWKIGQKHTVSWDHSLYTDADTVNVFVDEDRSISLGHGSALVGRLDVELPSQLASFNGQLIHIVAVFRRDLHLYNVENVAVQLSQ
ncbi:uncharacterized protein BX664DRAFT_340928 [Halteromyces radiatus]|uniref:uncharacterized protein n=1 Tax=Halteromyces radiatus TaxID=101107 RepID=UPI00222044B9|nr:uncharacterized protein BX664DRAFT_340928 [Halteromyces radiatus]KAI8081651.1 hypothetical protein BX664DRAFT_340928 [Halteromyces radiatus]